MHKIGMVGFKEFDENFWNSFTPLFKRQGMNLKTFLGSRGHKLHAAYINFWKKG
jgi:hypothetical protein